MSLIFTRNFDTELEDPSLAAPKGPSPEEIEEIRREAFEAGRAQGRAEGVQEAAETLEARREAALERIVPALLGFLGDRDAHDQAIEAQFFDFAISVCEKVFPELLENQAHHRALAQLRRGLRMALGSRKIRVIMAPVDRDLLKADLEALSRQNDGEPRLQISTDQRLGSGDVRIEWDHGGLDYSFAALCSEILEALRRARPRNA